jgi:flagellar biosynthesis component FlhA
VLKPVLALAAAGFLSVALWKILSILFLPLAGVVLGLVMTILKLAALVAIVMLVIWWLRKNGGKEGPAD